VSDVPLAVVWGVTGFIGRAITKALIVNGVKVRGISRGKFHTPPKWQGLYEHFSLDFNATADQLRKVVRGASFVVHCAGHFEANEELFNVYCSSCVNLSAVSTDEGVKSFLLLSSLSVYGSFISGFVGIDTPLNPVSSYGRSRVRAEEMTTKALARSDVKLLILRIPAVIGVGMKSIVITGIFTTICSGLFLHPGRKSSCLACIGISRLAFVVVALIRHSNHEQPVSIIQIVDNIQWTVLVSRFSEILGLSYIRIPLPGMAIVRALNFLKIPVPGPLFALTSEAQYASTDDFMTDNLLPETMEDIDALIRSIS
jgi:nucleoside-diphosphate-sugar epimerase